jgi:beta-phosphoglucomutase-like phosphatase (HAD superfamily)
MAARDASVVFYPRRFVHAFPARGVIFDLDGVVAEQGVQAYPGSVAFLRSLRDAGVPTAVVSASRNCRLVVDRAGVADLFDVRVDGIESAGLGLAGQPRPDLFLEAADRLDVDPVWAVVVAASVRGVEAARRGRFGLVVGVDREGPGHGLRAHGADLVVPDLGLLGLDPLGAIQPLTAAHPPTRSTVLSAGEVGS